MGRSHRRVRFDPVYIPSISMKYHIQTKLPAGPWFSEVCCETLHFVDRIMPLVQSQGYPTRIVERKLVPCASHSSGIIENFVPITWPIQ